MRELRLVLLGLAAVIALLLGGTFALRAIKGPPPAPQVAEMPQEPDTAPPPADATPVALTPDARKAARASIERAIAESPDYTRFFDRLRLVFPSEYDAILDGLATGAKSTVSVASTAGTPSRSFNPDVVMTDAVAALRRAHGALAAKASDTALGQIFALQLAEMRELEKRDPHLCVAFLYGTNGIGFLAFASEHRALVADAAIAGLDAMSSGQTDKVQRGAPSETDFQALDKALVDKGLSRPEIEALLDGKTPEPPIADDRMCKAGETYLETLAAMPAEARARLYGLAVDLMAKT